jgi:hypothetical protein
MKGIMKKIMTCAIVFGSLLLADLAKAQDINIALHRGYRAGYSDGYMAGYRDASEGKERNYQNHPEYQKADRAYKTEFGALEDYQDGYRLGFERGYKDGFEKLEFKPEMPSDLKKNSFEKTEQTSKGSEQFLRERKQMSKLENEEGIKTSTEGDEPIIIIPADTELIIELEQELSTEANKTGDKFIAKVVSPSEISGAMIEGRVNKIQKPGRIKRRAEMLLSFDIIRINERRWANYNAMVIEVLPLKGDNIKQVDNEGTLQGKSSVKDDAKKVAISTGASAVAGGVIGGPVGVAVGAGVGAAFGIGTIFADSGKHIKLSKGQRLRIRTVYETRIR